MKSINSIHLLCLATFTLLVMAMSALGQLNTDQLEMNEQYLGELNESQQLIAKYSATVSSGAPVPVAPSNPESLGIHIPSEPATYSQVPPTGESGETLIPTGEPSALKQISGDPINMIVAPPGIGAANKLYVSSIFQTVASSPLHGWLPIWLQIDSSGPIWLYEWYPDGKLGIKYLGDPYPGWYKIWFYSEIPGWHILQYYSEGWSNYIYVYVSGPREWNGLVPSSGLWSSHRLQMFHDDPWIEVGISNSRIVSRNTVAKTANGPWVDPAPDENPLDPSVPHW